MQYTTTPNKGFTIVELLIVIVVIGILAAITLVAFGGIQTRANNTARVNEAKEWQRIFTAYHAQFGTYPIASGSACLGTGFPDVNSDGIGDCWDLQAGNANLRSENTTLINEAKKVVSSLPNSTRKPVPGATSLTRLGPVFSREGSYYRIVYWLEGPGSDGCPVGEQTARWTDGVSRSCNIELSPL